MWNEQQQKWVTPQAMYKNCSRQNFHYGRGLSWELTELGVRFTKVKRFIEYSDVSKYECDYVFGNRIGKYEIDFFM